MVPVVNLPPSHFFSSSFFPYCFVVNVTAVAAAYVAGVSVVGW